MKKFVRQWIKQRFRLGLASVDVAIWPSPADNMVWYTTFEYFPYFLSGEQVGFAIRNSRRHRSKYYAQ
jgi:hypothetical protein